MKIFIQSLNSCGMRRTNIRRYHDFFVANGHEIVSHPAQSDVNLIWTCAFRGDFRDNSLSEIHRYVSDYNGELIVIGCLPDIDRNLLQKEYPGRFINWRNDETQLEDYFGSSNKRMKEIPRLYGESPICEDVETFRKEHPDKDITFVDQFIKLFVAEGCKYHCAYCAEILAFPPFHSFPMEDLVETCRDLIAKTGKYKIMLLGDDIGDYGCDLGLTLPNLIRALLEVHPQIALGLQGFNPANFLCYFDEMERFIQDGKIHHMQLPIQSASDRVLQRMNRPYCKKDILRVFGLLKQLHFDAIDTHLLIGFPGETEEDFQESLDFVLEYRPHYVLVSKYMETHSMPSSTLSDKVSLTIQNRRLKEAGDRIRKAGIICNTDDSELSVIRCRNMNRIAPNQEMQGVENGRKAI